MKSAIDYIKQSIKFYFQKQNFLFFAKIMVVLTIVPTLLALLMDFVYPPDVYETIDFGNVYQALGFLSLSFLIIISSLYARSTALQSVVDSLVDTTDTTSVTGVTEVKGVFLRGFKKILIYTAASFLLGLIVLLGLVLLIAPGIMFAVWFSFTLFLIFDKNYSIKDALIRSKQLVKGKFWGILGRFIIFGIFGIIVSSVIGYVPYAGSVLVNFIAPFFLLPTYFLYKDLMGEDITQQDPKDVSQPHKTI